MSNVLAKVDGLEITQKDLENMMRLISPDALKRISSNNREQAFLNEMINQKLIYLEAKEQKLDETPEFLTQLEFLKENFLMQIAVKKIMDEVSVSEEEKKSFYEQNKDIFVEDEKVEASHILVDTKEEADKVYSMVKAGEDFSKIAQEYSSCPSKSSGGSLGKFGKGQMVSEFEEAAYALEEGKISEPIKTQFGYHVIKLDKKYPKQQFAYEDVANEIAANLVDEKQHTHYRERVQDLMMKHSVEML